MPVMQVFPGQQGCPQLAVQPPALMSPGPQTPGGTVLSQTSGMTQGVPSAQQGCDRLPHWQVVPLSHTSQSALQVGGELGWGQQGWL
jgi:hypothetical protein